MNPPPEGNIPNPQLSDPQLTNAQLTNAQLTNAQGSGAPDGDLQLESERAELAQSANWQWRDGPLPPGPGVVFDIDGVLSDAAGRQHFLEGGQRNWVAFFDRCGDDPVIEEVARLIELLDPDLSVVLLTGRPQRVRPQTLAWLARYGLRWDLLVMRPFDERAPVARFKREAVQRLRRYGFDIRLAMEDDPSNHAMFVAEGIPCVYIHSGYYE